MPIFARQKEPEVLTWGQLFFSSYAKAFLTKESSQIHKQELSSEDVINIFLHFN